MRHAKSFSVALFLLFTAATCYAQDYVAVTMDIPEDLSSVHGILITASSTEEIFSVETQTIKNSALEVRVPVPSDVSTDAFVGAVAKTKSGQVIFSPLRSAREKNSTAVLGIPDCKADAIPAVNKQIPLTEQVSLLESVIHVRSEKKKQSMQRITQVLSGDLLERARALESSFGLQGSKLPLSADLPPTELNDRLSRLNDTIKRYHQARVEQEGTNRAQ